MPQTALTDQTVIGETNAGAQFAPAIAALPDGSYVIAWLDDARGAIFAQLYDSSGQRIGHEFQVSSPGQNLLFSSVAALRGGGFVIGWQSGVFNSADIHARRYDATGTAVGNEFTVNTTLPNEQLDVRVIGLTNGGFLFAWDTIASDKYQDISGRLYNSAGDPLGPEFTINTNTVDSQGIPSIAPLAGGGFVATWQSVFPAGAAHAVLIGQRFASDGSKLGGEFQVNTDTTNSPTGNDVATLSDGSFVVSWIDPVPSNGGGRIVARHYAASGNPLSGEIVIATASGGGLANTALTALVGGAYVVSWTDRNNAVNQLSARMVGADDTPVGDAFAVSNGSPFEAVLYPDGAATLANGHVVFAWDGPSTNTSEDVYYRMYDISAASLTGTPGPDNLTGTSSDDLFLLQQGGSDAASGGGGNDGFYLGGALDAADSLDGGPGTNDQLGLQGNYSGGLVLGAGNLTNIEALVLLSGSDARFGDTSGTLYSYNLTTVDANVGTGQTLTVNWNTLRVGENVTFNGSAELDGKFLTYGGAGNDHITGGQQDDGFFFAGGKFGSGDIVDGQGGSNDQLGLQGDYSGGNAIHFGAGQLVSMEAIVLLSGADTRFNAGGSTFSYDLTMDNGNLAGGATLTVNANTLRANETLSFNGAAELDGSFKVYGGAGADGITGGAQGDTLYGGAGLDTLTGGLGNDTFLYMSAADSTAAAPDAIQDFTLGDLIDLSHIDAIAGGSDDPFAFIGSAAFGHHAGELRAEDQGAGFYLVQGDIDGDGTADLQILAFLSDNATHTLGAGDFVL